MLSSKISRGVCFGIEVCRENIDVTPDRNALALYEKRHNSNESEIEKNFRVIILSQLRQDFDFEDASVTSMFPCDDPSDPTGCTEIIKKNTGREIDDDCERSEKKILNLWIARISR